MLRKKPSSFISLLVAVVLAFHPLLSFALPEGGEVQSGSATFNYDQLQQLLNIYTSDRSIINWQNFSIALQEAVRFYQPSADSISLNRVVGVDPSQILGQLTSNGKIFLINPNGIVFGQGCRVDTAGLVASTLNISNEDFLAGRFTFFGQGGAVINQGYISAPGGYVALLGSAVQNSGIIEANLGSVALASGQRLTLNLDPQGLISVVIDEALTQNLTGLQDAVTNTGRITADGGRVILTSAALDGIFDKAINNEGIIEARSLVNREGEIYLLASGETSLVSNTGSINVSAAESGANGGFVELSGGEVDFANGIINTSTIDAENGTILFDPWDLWIGNLQAWWLENQNGSNIFLNAGNDIFMNLGGDTPDNTLYLRNFDTETFTLLAGRHIFLNNDSIVTNGGNIELFADGHAGWQEYDPSLGIWAYVWPDGIGNVHLGYGAGLNSNGGNIILSGVNIFLAALVNAGEGNVTITATDRILDYDDANGLVDIIANNLNLEAANGIGSSNALETHVANLQATNTNSGNIEIQNTRGLSIYGSGVRNSALNGDVLITTNSFLKILNSLNLGTGILADGDIVLTAIGADADIVIGGSWGSTVKSLHGNVEMQADRNIVLGQGGWGDIITQDGLGHIMLYALGDILLKGNSQIHSNAGDVVLNARNNIGFLTDGWLSTNTGNISFVAGNDINLGGLSRMWSNLGNIVLSAVNNIYLSFLQTNGNVSVTADSDSSGTGAIIDNNNDAPNVIASNLILSAALGIGSSNALETQVSNLSATNTSSGDIRISNTGDLNLVNVNQGGGDIIISTNQNLSLISVLSNLGNIVLSAANNIYLGLLSTGGNVTLTASNGAIIDNNNEASNVIASNLILSAAQGIGSGNALETQINTLSANNASSGNIEIKNTGDLNLSGVSHSGSGNIDISTNQNLKVSDTLSTNSGDIFLTADGNIEVFQINAQGNGTTTGNVFLNAGANILGIGSGIHLISAADTHLNAGGIAGSYPFAALIVDVGKDLYLGISGVGNLAFGSVGALGVSATLGGNVSGSIIIPSNVITSIIPFLGNPAGYIFFNGKEIWPNMLVSDIYRALGDIYRALALNGLNLPKLYMEFLENYRFVSFDSSAPNLYFYHPLTPADYSAFDDILLDAGAYDFIDGNLKLKDNKIYSYYE